jgi:hypothetical protein
MRLGQVSYLATLYYMASMALTGLDAAVLASNRVYLLGEVNAFQWFVQVSPPPSLHPCARRLQTACAAAGAIHPPTPPPAPPPRHSRSWVC